MPSMPPAAALMTMTDRELSGGNLLDGYNAHAQAQGIGVPAGTVPMEGDAPEGAIPLKLLTETHPEYMGEFWADCEALYKGGVHLLRNDKAMTRLFPSHNAELPAIYEERKRRAFYINYAGTIIDGLVAGLESDPLRLGVAGADKESKATVPTWWSEWSEEVTAKGADLESRHTMHGFVVAAIQAAFVKQSSWILVDLPAVAREVAETVDSLAAQDELGLRDPYLCLLQADRVIDWETDDDGRLEWATVWDCTRRRAEPGKARGVYRHTWVIWDADGWKKYQLDVDPAKPPSHETMVPIVGFGEHPFEGVPLIRFKLPDGLWAMGKLESLAREHLNKRAASAWAEYKSLFAVLYEFMGPENPSAQTITAAAQKDPNRATNQRRGQGWTQRRGKDDDARYIGPDVAPFKEARESCAELMQEMHRVTSTMAASANMDGKALQRSGDSKADDRKDTQVVLEAVGMRGRQLLHAILDMVATGRGEEHGLDAVGLEAFSVQSASERIAEAVELFAGVPVLSPTFKRRFLERLYQVLLGDDADPKDLEEISKELATAIEAEGIMLGMGPGGAGSLAGGEVPVDPNAPKGDEEDDGDEDGEPKKPAKRPPPGPRRVVGTGPFAPKV